MLKWNDRAAAYEGDYAAAPIRLEILDFVLQAARETSPKVILDAGAGHGHLALALKSQSPDARLVLVDSSQSMLDNAVARMSGREGVEYHNTCMSSLGGVPSGSVDFYTSTFALHHLQDDRKRMALAEARRVLRPGGRIFIADEIICDPALFQDPDGLLEAMGQVFYPDLSFDALRDKFRDFVEYPTDLTTMARLSLDVGLMPKFHVVNSVVAILEVGA